MLSRPATAPPARPNTSANSRISQPGTWPRSARILVVGTAVVAITLGVLQALIVERTNTPGRKLVFLGAIADRGIGAAFFIAKFFDAGVGIVTAVSYEYGNTFLMTAGLLNFLVVLDAFDVAMGRK